MVNCRCMLLNVELFHHRILMASAVSNKPSGVGTEPRYNLPIMKATLISANTIKPWRKSLRNWNKEGWGLVADRVSSAHNITPPLDAKSVQSKVNVMITLCKVRQPSFTFCLHNDQYNLHIASRKVESRSKSKLISPTKNKAHLTLSSMPLWLT